MPSPSPGLPTPTLPSTSPSPSPSPSPDPGIIRKVFQTPWNIFGVCRKYVGKDIPSHDPEDFMGLNDLVDASTSSADIRQTPNDCGTDSFYPYPNRNSFLLGAWYWSDGIQKSQESFRQLINIIGDPEFNPMDVRDTNWARIDSILGGNQFDGEEWEDQEMGWIRTPVTIGVPIQRTTWKKGTPSIDPQTYTIGNFYHRPFVSVIREKLTNTSDHQFFHYEPFEFLWKFKAGGQQIETQIYGELYTSPEFIKIHRDLQESPPEPGCSLPRVVVALMFWSDVTHLNLFSNAKLWPLYMGFGNESKYRRCQPSLALLNHVAYFEKVVPRDITSCQ